MTIHNLPAGFVEFCAAHGRAGCGCLEERTGKAIAVLYELRARPIEEQRMIAETLNGVSLPSAPTDTLWIQAPPMVEPVCVSSVFGTSPVSLPSAPVVEEAPAEETQPSGWRDRPGLF